MAVIDPDRVWTVDARRFRSKGRNTPFEGRRVTGCVERTFASGVEVYTFFDASEVAR